MNHFLEKIEKISNKDKINLRRHFGKPADSLPVQTHIQVMKCMNSNNIEAVPLYALIAEGACGQEFALGKTYSEGENFSLAVAKNYSEKNIEQIYYRLLKERKISKRFISDLTRILMRCLNDGHPINYSTLLYDITHWNEDTKNKWMMKYANAEDYFEADNLEDS